MAFELPALPYDHAALEPHMSARTLEFHHDKHHATYVKNLNAAVEGTADASKDLVTLIKESHGNADKVAVFNNAAQVWNHTFFFSCMKPGGGGRPEGELLSRLDADFGDIHKFIETFRNTATGQFGSGWGWLVLDNGTLKCTKTANAENPLVHGQTPLLTVDVWEHAYYLDYQNRRPDFIQTFLDHLVNWDFVADALKNA